MIKALVTGFICFAVISCGQSSTDSQPKTHAAKTCVTLAAADVSIDCHAAVVKTSCSAATGYTKVAHPGSVDVKDCKLTSNGADFWYEAQ